MTRPGSIVAAMALAAGIAGPAAAQIQTLPQEGRAETRAGGINNSLSTQSIDRGAAQQNQFEVNALRNQPPAPQPQTPPGGVVAPRR